MRANMNVKNPDTCVKICNIVKTSGVFDVMIGKIDPDLSHTEEIDPQDGKKNMMSYVPQGKGDTRQSLDHSVIILRGDIIEMMHISAISVRHECQGAKDSKTHTIIYVK